MKSQGQIKKTIRTLALTIAALGIVAATAQAAPAPAPKTAWKMLAVSAPTNLPPNQSEVQRVIVEAEGGTFTLSRKVGDGEGTPVTANGVLNVEKDNPVAKIVSGSYEVGARVTGNGIPAETTILSCSADCVTAGSNVTLSNAPESPASGTANRVVKVFTTKLSAVTGTAQVGDLITGTGIAPRTFVTEVGAGTLTTTKATTADYVSGTISFVVSGVSSPASFNASAAELQAALEASPSFAPGSFTVSGGPGGDAEHPYFIAYGGPFADQDVEQFSSDASALVGEHKIVRSFTTVPGGPGTGVVVVIPANIGAKASFGQTTVTVGPLPAGIVTSGPAKGKEWECPGSEAGQSSVTCVTTRPVGALSPNPNVLNVPVEVQAGAPFTASSEVRISGAGDPTGDVFELPFVVSNQPATFGLAAMWAGAYEADGSNSVQAGGHPYSAASYFMVNTVRTKSGAISPAADPHGVIVDLQPGFVGNPMVTKRCPQALVADNRNLTEVDCNREMSIGYLSPYVGTVEESINFEEQRLYNNVPPKGYPAAFSSRLVLPLQTILASVRSDGDYGVRLTASNNANYQKLFGAFAAFEGVPREGTGQALLSNPTACTEQKRKTPVVSLEADAWQKVGEFVSAPDVPVEPVAGCEALEFHPGFTFQPSTTTGSSPTGITARLHLPTAGLTDPARLAEPQLKRTVAKLPSGLVLNPSGARGLQACSEAQIGYMGDGFELPNPMRFTEDSPSCPDGSKLGTVEVLTPLLADPLVGHVYLAAQDKNPFNSTLAVYLVIDDAKSGITMKLPGEVSTDPVTGQITTTFDYSPQLAFEDLILRFPGGGPRSSFATPEVCGRYETKGTWTPWSAPESGPPAQTSDGFDVSGNCAGSAGARPFSPRFEAGTGNPIAGGYAPLVIKVDRKDGEQELRQLNFTLPPGVTGKLAGIPYCSDGQIAAAAGKTGKEEKASPSCPGASRLGSVDTASGVGSEPFHVSGDVYLAGPYKGAPVSSVVITPALAGPFDLGNVVVRAPIYVDPETAQLTVRSDPIPTILKGIPLKVRSVAISVDRGQFGLNPTNCEVMSASAAIVSSDGATANPSNRFQVGNCDALRFAPKLKLRLKGGTRRNANPALTATLTQAPGQANIARVSVALPHSEFLDQRHIKTICTRVQFAANQCPKGSIYGSAEAISPLLDAPLTGPAYLRSSNNKLPDLVIALRGPDYLPIEVNLVGRIDSFKGGIRNSFELVPDAPVSKFVLKMQGGKKGLLVNSTNICRGKHRAKVKMAGQNGKLHNFNPPLQAQCKKKKKRRAGGHKRGKR